VFGDALFGSNISFETWSVVLSLFLFADLLDDALFIFFGGGNVMVCVGETVGIFIGVDMFFVFCIRYNIYAIFTPQNNEN